jgi:pimeloyl-ACP methyl ester carboxylesterase
MTVVEIDTTIQRHVDAAGHEFGYVHVRHPGSHGLVVHFSAFFGAWGNARVYRDRFQGYFHRLKMLGTQPTHDWLFLCDQYGAFDNGTYYTGEAGDFFVERGTRDIIETVVARGGYDLANAVFVGSSMGATAALNFGIEFSVAGIIAVSPHIDLDICAERQNRMQEVAFLCPDGDPLAAHNHRYTRQIRALVEANRARLPRLFLQACADDEGVHAEQVLPLVAAWAGAGGDVVLDERAEGGHTSDFATRALLLDAIDRLAAGEPIPLATYQDDPAFRGEITPAPLTHRVRGRLGRARRRVLG